MTRDLPIGNGALLVNFDGRYQRRDLYWPYVGQENHTAGHPARFGVWVEEQFRWVDDEEWEQSLCYQRDTLLTDVRLQHEGLGLSLHCQDAVDFHENLYLRQLTVQNHRETAREVRLFFAQDFHIAGSAVGDSAYYEPQRLAVYHYKGKRWFLINTARATPQGWHVGVDQWAVGYKESERGMGTWRDAEDGLLSGNAVAQGSVDSCVALHLALPAGGEATGWYWIAVGEDFPEVTRLNRVVRDRGPASYLERTRCYWMLWLGKGNRHSAPPAPAADRLYQRSLLTMRAHIDNGGAIIAATDYAVAREAQDTYCYMWPRDGALIASALIAADYPEVSNRFFTFCHQVITPEGYLLHKYNPDGSLASSWLGWYYEGMKELPIQQDETALVLWALWRHFAHFRDVEFIKPLYRGLITRAANWMLAYRNDSTGLPLPSWDLWEERRGVHAWTIGAIWGGLQAAANFAESFGESPLAIAYRQAAARMKAATDVHLWDAGLGRFLRAVLWLREDTYTPDATADASIAGLWQFGMYAADDPRMVATMTQLREELQVPTAVGGIARYQHDQYHRVPGADVPGNPWFICVLWFARWYADVARHPPELQPARDLLDWTRAHARPSDLLAEQLDPATGESVSVCPLTWSHAEYVLALQAYARARERVKAE